MIGELSQVEQLIKDNWVYSIAALAVIRLGYSVIKYIKPRPKQYSSERKVWELFTFIERGICCNEDIKLQNHNYNSNDKLDFDFVIPITSRIKKVFGLDKNYNSYVNIKLLIDRRYHNGTRIVNVDTQFNLSVDLYKDYDPIRISNYNITLIREHSPLFQPNCIAKLLRLICCNLEERLNLQTLNAQKFADTCILNDLFIPVRRKPVNE